MKLAIGLPVARLVLRSKKRGFCFSARHLAAAGHIALRCPAPRKPEVYVHVHPLGGVKLCFTARHRRAQVPGRRSRGPVSCFGSGAARCATS